MTDEQTKVITITLEEQRSLEEAIQADIEKWGWCDISVFGSDQSHPFNYTVGLDGYEHPELVAIGCHNEQLHGILCAVVSDIQAGRRFVANQYYDKILADYPVAMVEVTDFGQKPYPMSLAKRLSGCKVALQVVWPDENKRFPWHEDWDQEFTGHQPLLGEWRGE